EDRGAGRVAELHRHRDRVAAGLAQGGDQHLDDPEAEGDFRNLRERVPGHGCARSQRRSRSSRESYRPVSIRNMPSTVGNRLSWLAGSSATCRTQARSSPCARAKPGENHITIGTWVCWLGAIARGTPCRNRRFSPSDSPWSET